MLDERRISGTSGSGLLELSVLKARLKVWMLGGAGLGFSVTLTNALAELNSSYRLIEPPKSVYRKPAASANPIETLIRPFMHPNVARQRTEFVSCLSLGLCAWLILGSEEQARMTWCNEAPVHGRFSGPPGSTNPFSS